MDFDTGIERYRIIVQVSDNDPNIPRTVEVPIFLAVTAINEYDVVFDPAGPLTQVVDEDVPINFPVRTLVTKDDDRNNHPHGDHRYSILSGDPKGQFSIDTTSGAIVVASPLDYEVTRQYVLVILARDVAEERSAEITMNINVNDVNDNVPICDIRVFSVEVPEDLATPSVVSHLQT